MAVGFGVGLLGLISLLVAVATVVWLWRSVAAGEIGLLGGGLAPVIRRVRQPVKFWTAVGAIAILVLIPAALLAYFFLNLLDWPV
ncbi:hypothetical protein [Brevundimonas sp.]|uniref:hypothetical protein n=1 Tax=Brevundimonas sp. TaxID=1871086 RepID=UPI002737B3CC|nr:hypothetical protein [Brevundimonas sp.]MDP3800703.1 hypothetical protein [Brevundimonas sp.]